MYSSTKMHICIVGPSCVGKTTISHYLVSKLQAKLITMARPDTSYPITVMDGGPTTVDEYKYLSNRGYSPDLVIVLTKPDHNTDAVVKKYEEWYDGPVMRFNVFDEPVDLQERVWSGVIRETVLC